MKRITFAMAIVCLAAGTGCGGGATIQAGHRGLYYDPTTGLRPEVLNPKYYRTPCFVFDRACPEIHDYDVTYSTKKEVIHTTSTEGLAMDLHINVIYRPIVEELYKLDTETGPNYYDEVVGPEFRSAARGVMARHSYTELAKSNEKIEDEIENDLRRRIHGKHIEIASITMEAVNYAPEIAAAVRAKLVSEQESAREAAKREQERQATEQTMHNKEMESKLAIKQAEIDKVKAQAEALVRITKAEAEAKERTLLARAAAEEKKAETNSLTPLAVMMHAYDALGKLGGEGTTIMLGDWSRSPQFLFPPGYGFQTYGGAAPKLALPAPNKTTAAPSTNAPVKIVPASQAPNPRADAEPTNPY